jgi:hypothetical protein
MAEAAPPATGITPVPRNDMEMEMHNHLPCSLTDVHTDVVAVRVIPLVENVPGFQDEFDDRCLLPGSGVEKTHHMAEGDDERMTLRDRIDVPGRECEGVPERDALCRDSTEGAWTGHAIYSVGMRTVDRRSFPDEYRRHCQTGS